MPLTTRALALIFAVAAVPVWTAPASPAAVPAADKITLTPATPQTTFRVEATFPQPPGETCKAKLRKPVVARYRGTLEVIRTSDGRLAVIDALTFPQYLAGISEVPPSWPAEALKAQVVAARTYALYHHARPASKGRTLGYNICATDQCQVFRGVAVEQGPFGEAWVAAIADTTGQVLRYNGAVVQTFYFSTSSGRTKTNTQAFGGRALPYLPSVAGEDADAPLARWTARVPLADLAAVLVRAKRWPGGAITSVVLTGDEVVVAGAGNRVTLSKKAFRAALNDEAPCAFPDRYPGPGGQPGRKLPLTVPSIDHAITVSGGSVVITGRGWGHGVGMSQWGARSLAERGRTYKQILAHYYGGLAPRKVAEPGAIRVLAIEGAQSLRIRVEGAATARSGTGSTYGNAKDLTVTGGPALAVQRGAGAAPAPVLEIKVTRPPPASLAPDSTAEVGYDLSASARVGLVFERGGVEVGRTPEVSQERGPNRLSFGAAELFGTAEDPASIVVEAYDGIDRVRTTAMTVALAKPPSPSPVAQPSRRPEEGGGFPWFVAGVAAGLLVLAASLLLGRMRGRRRDAAQPNVNV